MLYSIADQHKHSAKCYVGIDTGVVQVIYCTSVLPLLSQLNNKEGRSLMAELKYIALVLVTALLIAAIKFILQQTRHKAKRKAR